jgi:hypothetical protein
VPPAFTALIRPASAVLPSATAKKAAGAARDSTMILGRAVPVVLAFVAIASLTCTADARANELLRAADRAFNSNSIDEAGQLYNQALADARARGDAVAAAEILNDLSALE